MSPPPNVTRGATPQHGEPAGAQDIVHAARRSTGCGHHEGAAAHCMQAVALAQSSGCTTTEAAALGLLAEAEARLGDGEQRARCPARVLLDEPS